MKSASLFLAVAPGVLEVLPSDLENWAAVLVGGSKERRKESPHPPGSVRIHQTRASESLRKRSFLYQLVSPGDEWEYKNNNQEHFY